MGAFKQYLKEESAAPGSVAAHSAGNPTGSKGKDGKSAIQKREDKKKAAE